MTHTHVSYYKHSRIKIYLIHFLIFVISFNKLWYDHQDTHSARTTPKRACLTIFLNLPAVPGFCADSPKFLLCTQATLHQWFSTFLPQRTGKKRKKITDWHHTVAMNASDYHSYFVNQRCCIRFHFEDPRIQEKNIIKVGS